MAVGTRWANELLRGLLSGGCLVSLHLSDPGPRGERGLLAGPFRVSGGLFSVTDAVATLTRGVTLGNASRGGRATHLSLWTRDRQFITSVRLRQPIAIENGDIVTLERRALTVRIG